MKGITPVIAVILLLLITVAMVGFAFVFFQRIAATATNATQSQINSQINQQSKDITIDNVNPAGSNVTIRNTGTASISNTELNLYVNSSLKTIACSSNSIPPGSSATCNDQAITGVRTCAPGTFIQVTAPGGSDAWTC